MSNFANAHEMVAEYNMLNALSVGMKRHPDGSIAIFDHSSLDASRPAIISRVHEMMRAQTAG